MKILSSIIRKLKNKSTIEINVFQKVVNMGLLLLINSTIFAGEKDFRGWKGGDYVVASIYSDLEWAQKVVEHVEDPVRKTDFLLSQPREDTFWCKIEAASGDALLVTGYYKAQRTLSQVNRNEGYEAKKIEPPLKFNIIGSTNLCLVEWQKNTEPPRPKVSWWSLFNK